MSKNTRIGIAALCLTLALLAGVASGLGVFARGDGATKQVVSVRGERYPMATTGVYANNAQRVVAEGIGWDIVTLFLVVPVMLLTLPALVRGSLRGRMLAMGLLAYFFYQYLMYAMTWAFGPLFLLFVVIYGAAAAGIVWIATTIPLAQLPDRFGDRFPLRGMAIFSWIMAAALTLMWLKRIYAGLTGDWAGAALLGETTMVVQVMDLGMLIPVAVFTGVAAWRARPVGYLLCLVFVVKSVTMAAAIAAMLLSAWAVEGTLEVAPFAMFAAATLVSLWLGVRMYRSGTGASLPAEASVA
jgi:hypothetical protein